MYPLVENNKTLIISACIATIISCVIHVGYAITSVETIGDLMLFYMHLILAFASIVVLGTILPTDNSADDSNNDTNDSVTNSTMVYARECDSGYGSHMSSEDFEHSSMAEYLESKYSGTTLSKVDGLPSEIDDQKTQWTIGKIYGVTINETKKGNLSIHGYYAELHATNANVIRTVYVSMENFHNHS